MILLVNPPLTDPGGPYPGISYLAGYLSSRGFAVRQADLGLEVIHRWWSPAGILDLVEEAETALRQRAGPMPFASHFARHANHYYSTIATAKAALLGRDPGAIARAIRPNYFPPSPLAAKRHAAHLALAGETYARRLGPLSAEQRRRLHAGEDVEAFAFGFLGHEGLARYRASRMLEDVTNVMREVVEPDLAPHEYAGVIVRSGRGFDDVVSRLEGPPNLMDRWIDDEAERMWRAQPATHVGLSVPFSGAAYGALRVARAVRALDPDVRIALGGGWVNTCLRELNEARLFDYVDAVMLDDGERPLECWIEATRQQRPSHALLRTYVRLDGKVTFVSTPTERDVAPGETGTPTYATLPLERYVPYVPHLQLAWFPWRRRWNKLTLAHGCYWKKCAFCDVKLDYVARYVPVDLDVTVERIRALVAETGITGFHFVDEAMPPALLRRLAQRLIDERIEISWWGNVRFDPQLADLAPLLAEAGCCRLTGGLEAASDRLLALMAKGVSLEQVAKVTGALSRCGIAVHAYLIYGFPTQTKQETVDALEYVRQLFAAGCLSSAAWHRFVLTRHSPVADRPEAFSVVPEPMPASAFAQYEQDFVEVGGIDHGQFSEGLHRAVETYMHGYGFDQRIVDWFSCDMPEPTLPAEFVSQIVSKTTQAENVARRPVHR